MENMIRYPADTKGTDADIDALPWEAVNDERQKQNTNIAGRYRGRAKSNIACAHKYPVNSLLVKC